MATVTRRDKDRVKDIVNGRLGPVHEILSLIEAAANGDEVNRAWATMIPPDVANIIIEKYNPNNRPKSQSRIHKYALALTNGQWRLNGEPIIIDSTGRVLDGQHRLAACVEAGVPLPTWVVFGPDPSVFPTLGRAMGRDNADDLAIQKEKNARALAAVLAVLWLDEHKQLMSIGQTPSSDTAQYILKLHPKVRESVSFVQGQHKLKGLLTPRIAGFCHYRFSQKDSVAADRFFRDLSTGVNLSMGDPVLKLRDILNRNSDSIVKFKHTHQLALTVMAWNFRRTRKKVGRNNPLEWDGEKVPAIV